MRAAMSAAEVGDDVYSDDPTVNALEEQVAALFGKPAALFTPSGSLANQLSIRALVKPGEELLCESRSHIARAELGAAAVFSGITTRTWNDPHGALVAARPLALAEPNAGPYLVSTAAIAIENTHNFGGGTVQSLSEIAELSKEARAQGISLHLDGARIWNAHVASRVPFHEYGAHFDTISVCLSKGLGAPVGSLMISDKERIATARVWRKRYGAGMRQVGILAAAGHYALENNIERLSEDHKNAQLIAIACNQGAPSVVDPAKVQTNIVGLDLTGASSSAAEFTISAREAGVLVSALGPKFVRLVTHLDISRTDAQRAGEVLSHLLQRAFVS